MRTPEDFRLWRAACFEIDRPLNEWEEQMVKALVDPRTAFVLLRQTRPNDQFWVPLRAWLSSFGLPIE